MKMRKMKKTLCRIRLINWHYFVNETVSVKGSCLITGENTSGKSTILDALQFVLTTSQRNFNKAANEKSNRALKGYVRCKTGDEGSIYLRKGNVISYVALEFFEEKTSKYFVLGAKIESPDEDSNLDIKWFREECRLENLSFINQGSPSTDEEFRRGDKKVTLIRQAKEARARFAQRLGNLDDRFFDIIPKSLAFKPIDRVKDFITNFILPERNIEVDALRTQIATLDELGKLMKTTKTKIAMLEEILKKYEDITAKEKEIKINNFMINKAQLENYCEDVSKLERDFEINTQKIKIEEEKKSNLEEEIERARSRKTSLEVALGQNETTRLINETEQTIRMLEKDIESEKKRLANLKNALEKLYKALYALANEGVVILSKEQLDGFIKPSVIEDDKIHQLTILQEELTKMLEDSRKKRYELQQQKDTLEKKRIDLQKEIEKLENKKLTFPENTERLMAEIEKEFTHLGIDAEVRVFSDLLEITDHSWQNAVEGYLNTQRFYIIVEPKYYQTALHVYYRVRNKVHTVGLVNTQKLDTNAEVDVDSLAYVVESKNRYARAYANYLLNRVKRCKNVDELKNHTLAITKECMLYTNYAVRKIDPKIYETPYIGAHAIEVQLRSKKGELDKVLKDLDQCKTELQKTEDLISKLEAVSFETIKENFNAPSMLALHEENLKKEKAELEKAKSDPSYMEIQMQMIEAEKEINRLKEKVNNSISLISDIQFNIKFANQTILDTKLKIKAQEEILERMYEEDATSANEGLAKYNEQRKTKSNETIVQNFSPMKVGLENAKNRFVKELMGLQTEYKNAHQIDLGIGVEQINEYINEHHKLRSSEIVKYEEELREAKEKCELEFRENFLARLRENIENARIEFKNLNYALKDIYYGEDSYRFVLEPSKEKKHIYDMIMSDHNIAGHNLFSLSFEEQYKEEMEDLFTKLIVSDDMGDKVVKEYTDYRNYLNYDIEVVKKDGSKQKFSKIYGEKSGGETQTPYYVAIAASFAQLYSHGDTVRLLLFDEAFDKMDDNRISSMMDFLNSQDFQIILATPTNKMDVIGEKVKSILLVYREGHNSIIQEFKENE